jgi:hypothetical protein
LQGTLNKLKEDNMAVQSNWRMCGLCMGIFFNGHPTKGVCPHHNGLPGLASQHLPDPSIRFQLTISTQKTPGFQDKWRWCRRCEGLFFHGNSSDGRCPAVGLGHDFIGSGSYQIQFAKTKQVAIGGFGFGEIVWCAKCEGMWVNFGSNFGTCSDGAEHSKQGSGSYLIPTN